MSQTIQQQAEKLVLLRASIKELEDNFDKIILPLKAEKEALDLEMIQELIRNGFKSVKTDKAMISIVERKTVQIIDENKVIEKLKELGLRDLYKEQIVKSLFKGYGEKLAKDGVAMDGTSINVTSFISVRTIKKLN